MYVSENQLNVEGRLLQQKSSKEHMQIIASIIGNDQQTYSYRIILRNTQRFTAQ